MKITLEYLTTLPNWMSWVLMENSVEDIYDPDIDWMKYPGDFEYRIFSHEFPILLQDKDGSLNIIFKEEKDGKIYILSDCHLVNLTIGNNELVEMEIPVTYQINKNVV